jgi:hypothetical protein
LGSAFAHADGPADLAECQSRGQGDRPFDRELPEKAGLAVLFLVLFALFIDERPLLGFLGSAVGAEAGSVGEGVLSVFFALALVMFVVTWAEWRKMRSARPAAAREPRAPSAEK